MDYINIKGRWLNEFNSLMEITEVDSSTGIFSGTYASTTGATGKYLVTGLTDTEPEKGVNSQAIAFTVSWRDLGGDPTGAHWMSAFSGQLQIVGNEQVISTTYLLQKNFNPENNWESVNIDKAAFKKQPDLPVGIHCPHVNFPLTREKLTDNGATPWISQMGIGTPPQRLAFMIDSGTDNTWVTSIRCSSDACSVHARFEESKSHTYHSLDTNPVQKDFGPWGSITVVIGADILTLTHHHDGNEGTQVSTSEKMNFEAAIHYTGFQFQQLDCDGGIAIPSPYWKVKGMTESLMLQLLKDRKIDYPVASFWSDPEQKVGECILGAVNPAKYDPETLQWLPLQKLGNTSLSYLWSVKLDGFLVSGQPVNANIKNFVLDTGSSCFKGPKDIIDSLVSAVTCNGQFPTHISSRDDLENYPVISLQICQRVYKLRPIQYFMKLNDNYWELGITVLDGMPEEMLLVGSLFLDTVYSIFDYGGAQIGLANLKK